MTERAVASGERGKRRKAKLENRNLKIGKPKSRKKDEIRNAKIEIRAPRGLAATKSGEKPQA
jgi:hypothetical protein